MNCSRSAIRGVILVVGVSAVLADCPAEEKRLTSDGQFKSCPVFVDHTGAEIVYVVQESAVQLRLMKLKLADGSTTPVHPTQTKNEFEPAFSRDGKWLAFIQSRGNLSLAVVMKNLSNGTETEIPPGGGFSGARSPAIAPDGSMMLYCYAETDTQSILMMPLPQGKPHVIISGAGVNNWPDFAPDGQRFVFGSSRDGNFEIYTARPDGSDLHRLTTQPLQDLRPRFAPDGQRIVFTSGRDGNYEIYLMRPDGTEQTRLTANPERDDYPIWHPDGNRIVYVAERNGKHDLFLADLP
ncbi:MAG: hypothetical protein FJ295_06125 [Planctomycetes bacterium]|nr:hypothetical protein [Planctomycetota bacterium]